MNRTMGAMKKAPPPRAVPALSNHDDGAREQTEMSPHQGGVRVQSAVAARQAYSLTRGNGARREWISSSQKRSSNHRPPVGQECRQVGGIDHAVVVEILRWGVRRPPRNQQQSKISRVDNPVAIDVGGLW